MKSTTSRLLDLLGSIENCAGIMSEDNDVERNYAYGVLQEKLEKARKLLSNSTLIETPTLADKLKVENFLNH